MFNLRSTQQLATGASSYICNFSGFRLCFGAQYSDKVPKKCIWKDIKDEQLHPVVNVDQALIDYLEKITLVRFNNEDGVRQLYDTIRFADRLCIVDTAGIEPLHSLNENGVCYLRPDQIGESDCRNELMSLAEKVVEEMYYVAPPGNIPLQHESKKRSTKKYDKQLIETTV